MMKTHPILFNGEMVRAILDGRKTQTRMIAGYAPTKVPYSVGDRLWVRETALYLQSKDGPRSVAAYAADGYELEDGEVWTPSIHMPRWASRITLEITDVRVQRIQEISDGDLLAEGAETDEYLDFLEYAESVAPPGSRVQTLREYFAGLWDSCYAKKGFGWGVNPWVWAISFRKEGGQ